MDDKKKKYKEPEAEIVKFTVDDIITASLAESAEEPGWTGEGWWD